jgi:transcription elongation factor GreA
MDKVPMTAGGYEALTEELRRLKTVERPRIIKALEAAREMGDIAENAEYHAAKEQQGLTERRVFELEDKLRRAEVIDVSKLKGKELPDRRRRRGRHPAWPTVDHLAARARADRQEGG